MEQSSQNSDLIVKKSVTFSSASHLNEPDFSDVSQWELFSCCPLCGHSDLQPWKTARDRHYGITGTFSVVKCVGCGLTFLNPMPSTSYLASAYPESYYAYNFPISGAEVRQFKATAKKLLTNLLCFHSGVTKDPQFKCPGRILDVGCGNGFFLLPMRKKGWEVYGVEPAKDAAERGRREGLDIFAGSINEAHYPSEYFDFIRSNHSFEHIRNPREVLREARRIIKPDGCLFIGVPNVNGIMARFFGTYWWYLGSPVHTFGYSPKTLEKMLDQEGFRVEKVNFNSTYAGIFGSLQIYLNRNSNRLSDVGWVIRNPALKLIGHWAARFTDLLRVGDCIEITARPK